MASKDEKENQECWRFLTTGERVLLILLIITSIALLAVFITIVIMLLQGDNICNTADCVKTSAKILEIFDRNKDACDNFDEFICEKEADNLFDEYLLIKELLLQNDPSLINPTNFYSACTNHSAIEEEGYKTIHAIIEALGWPVLLGQNWRYSDFNWLNFSRKLRNFGLKYDWLLEFNWKEDNNETKILKIAPPNLRTITSIREIYYDVMLEVAIRLNSSKIIASRELRKVIEFETDLIAIAAKANNNSLSDELKISVEELNTYWPQINLIEFLNDLAKGYSVFTENSTVVLPSKDYIIELNGLIGRTPRSTQANFLVWKSLEFLAPYLPDSLRLEFIKYLNIEDRDEFCLNEVVKRYYNSLQEKLADKFVTENVKSDLNEMVARITDSTDFNLILEDWETVISQNFAFSSDNILRMIIEEYYSRENDFYKCLNSNITCEYERYSVLPEHEIIFHENTIYIPKSILLKDDYYNIDHSKFINYAGLGYKIASTAFNESNTVDNVYHAYVRWTQEHGIEKKLPALDFTPKQLFWIWMGHVNPMGISQIVQSNYFINDFRCNR